MTTIRIPVIYKDGAWQPQFPLDLPEETAGIITVELPSATEHLTTPDAVHAYLVQTGLAAPRAPGMPPPLSEQERARLAAHLGGGRPASELIHEDRAEQF